MKKPNQFYEKHVKDYQKVTNLWFPRRHQRLIDLIHNNPKFILDVGCGTGVMLKRIENRIPRAKYYGIDLSEPMITFAKIHYPNYNFKVSSAESLPFNNEKFDLITNSIAFHHYKNPKRSLDEAYRVLKKNGQLLLMDITPKHTVAHKLNDFGAKYIIRDGHVSFQSLEGVKRLLSQANFQSIEQYFVGFPGVWVTVGYKR